MADTTEQESLTKELKKKYPHYPFTEYVNQKIEFTGGLTIDFSKDKDGFRLAPDSSREINTEMNDLLECSYNKGMFPCAIGMNIAYRDKLCRAYKNIPELDHTIKTWKGPAGEVKIIIDEKYPTPTILSGENGRI